MSGKVKIQLVYIKVETFNRLRSVRRIPSKQWGKRLVPEYWGSFIDKYAETIEFQLLERDADIQRLKGEVGTKDFALKMKTSEIEKKNKEIETLKRQLADMTEKLLTPVTK